jgi:alkanesulfonate monooxygenase SsuD/methylene tetrahydromethanopterin reductase-like flavin-dependent oxidoreductase (luciferase family)
MKLGIFLTPHHPLGENSTDHLADLFVQAEAADRLGFDSIFLGHHYLSNSAFFQPIPLAAALAERTERVAIGFGVHLLPLHNPLAMAEELATLDLITGGRLIAGFGCGYRTKEYRAFGIPFEERYRRLDESVSTVQALWRGEAVSVEGSFGTLRDAQVHLRPTHDGGPPVWLGAFGARGIRRVAEHDACWLAPPDRDDDGLREGFDTLRAAYRERGLNTDREYPVAREGYISTTGKGAAATAREHLLSQYRNYRSWDGAQSMDPDTFLAKNTLLSSPTEAVERLRHWERELGVTHVVLRTQWDGMAQEDAMASILAIGEEVIPELGVRS